MEEGKTQSKEKFIGLNLLKSVIYLLTVIVIIIAGKHFFKLQLDSLIDSARQNLPLFYAIFFLLEILPGQLPPEIFFVLYSKETTSFSTFMGAVFLLGCLSYVAINMAYYIGRILPRLRPGNWFEKNSRLVHQYGSAIIVLGMFTPLPSAFISMAAGYLNFPHGKFMVLTLCRFIRFLAYGPAIYFST